MSLLSLLPGGELLDELPETDEQECRIALAEGRYWDASFDCPALRFVRGVFGGPDDEDDGDDEEQP
jgi:hypothetical protein